MKIVLDRIDNSTYSFKLSDKQGIQEVAKSLTFPNPNPISRNRKIEFFAYQKIQSYDSLI